MNMQTIGKKISKLRKERDMTQVELADKLGVTYQAVSIDELLDNEKAAEIVANVLTGNISSSIATNLEALADVAPILKPSQVSILAKQSNDGQGSKRISIDGDMLIELAPHMESEDLREVILRYGDIGNVTITEIACYLETC